MKIKVLNPKKDKEEISSEIKDDVPNDNMEKVSQITSPEEKEEIPNGDKDIETKKKKLQKKNQFYNHTI